MSHNRNTRYLGSRPKPSAASGGPVSSTSPLKGGKSAKSSGTSQSLVGGSYLLPNAQPPIVINNYGTLNVTFNIHPGQTPKVNLKKQVINISQQKSVKDRKSQPKQTQQTLFETSSEDKTAPSKKHKKDKIDQSTKAEVLETKQDDADVGIVDHGRFTQTLTASERAALNIPQIELPKYSKNLTAEGKEAALIEDQKKTEQAYQKRKQQKQKSNTKKATKHDDSKDRENERLTLKNTALYMDATAQILELAGGITEQDAESIENLKDQISEEFRNGEIRPLIKEFELAKTTPPELELGENSSADKKTQRLASTHFNKAFTLYKARDYKKALAEFLNAYNACKKLITTDVANSQTHANNALLVASYMGYLIQLILDNKRTELSKQFPERVDPLTTLFQEEFEYYDPCIDKQQKPCNQPSKKEFDYASTAFPLFFSKLKTPEDCATFKAAEQQTKTNIKSKTVTTKKGKQKRKADDDAPVSVEKLEKSVAIMQAHEFRVDQEKKKPGRKKVRGKRKKEIEELPHPTDLKAKVQGQIIDQVLSANQVQLLVDNTTNFADFVLAKSTKNNNEKTSKKRLPLKKTPKPTNNKTTKEEKQEKSSIESSSTLFSAKRKNSTAAKPQARKKPKLVTSKRKLP